MLSYGADDAYLAFNSLIPGTLIVFKLFLFYKKLVLLSPMRFSTSSI